jgi:hypothetical protein
LALAPHVDGDPFGVWSDGAEWGPTPALQSDGCCAGHQEDEMAVRKTKRKAGAESGAKVQADERLAADRPAAEAMSEEPRVRQQSVPPT